MKAINKEGIEIRFNRGNSYFDTYHIFNNQGKLIGILEDHCRQVKNQYFVGWKLHNPSKMSGSITGETESFETEEKAIFYSVGEIL